MKPFVGRLRNYLESLAQVLRGEASTAAVFPNTTDSGQGKERVFLELLRHHLPSSCNVFMGGYLFDLQGAESKQVDLIVSESSSLRFDQLNKGGDGKAFACIDGVLAAISVKSYLDKRELLDALDNIASIPRGAALNRENSAPFVDFSGWGDGPTKVVFALDGVKRETLMGHIKEFYLARPEIPLDRCPNFIHVLGKYSWIRTLAPTKNDAGEILRPGTFAARTLDVDVYFLAALFTSIEKAARMHRYIFYDYTPIFDLAIPPHKS